jgi:CubicO group peptidase (beta-lactamase class C family)
MRTWINAIGACLMVRMLLGANAVAAPVDLGPTLAPLLTQYKLPGMVGCIIRGDDIVALGSAGVRKVGDPAPFLPTDLIHLGSDTKAMTAILIGQLIDKGQLTFDTPMSEIFPDIATKMAPAMAAVTVRQLLDHDAGLPHDLPWGLMDVTHLPLPAQRRMAVQQALSMPPATPIGSFAYSNVGFVLLGAIVERKTGLSWEQVIRKEIFNPLHMGSAGFGPPGTPGKVDQPWGHVLEDGQLKPVQSDNLAVMGPAGRVHCSISDWAKFISETVRAEQGHPTLLSAKTFTELTTPMPGQNYAGGWIITQRDWAGGLALTHAGSNTMWYCDVWIAPSRNFAVMDATNDGADSAFEALDKGVGLLIGVNQKIVP